MIRGFQCGSLQRVAIYVDMCRPIFEHSDRAAFRVVLKLGA